MTPMPSQPIFLGTGLAILLVISAASTGLDVKSRSDVDWVDHTLGVQKKISDLRLLTRRAESAARGFALNNDPNLVKEYQDASDRIAPAFAELTEATKDNPDQTQLLKDSEKLVAGARRWRLSPAAAPSTSCLRTSSCPAASAAASLPAKWRSAGRERRCFTRQDIRTMRSCITAASTMA